LYRQTYINILIHSASNISSSTVHFNFVSLPTLTTKLFPKLNKVKRLQLVCGVDKQTHRQTYISEDFTDPANICLISTLFHYVYSSGSGAHNKCSVEVDKINVRHIYSIRASV